MKPLPPKQQRFVAEYLVDFNATQACIRAGYSRKTAAEQGYDLLRKPQIAGAIQQARDELVRRAALSAEDVVDRLCELADSDPATCFDANGNLRHIKDMPPATRRAIRRIKVLKRNLEAGDGKQDEVTDVEFWDKNQPLQNLGKYHGILVDRKETGKPGEFSGLSDDEKVRRFEALLQRVRSKLA